MIDTGPSKKSKLRRHLKADIADESEAVQNYGTRQTQLNKYPKLRNVVKGIQQDERGHRKKLRKIHGRLN
jgi:rubrerythrin